MNYALHLLILFDIYLVVAISMNIMLGYVGLLTLAHAGYFALGAYAYALTSLLLEWNFLAASGASVVAALAFSGLLAIASWRFRGDFFVLFSLAIQVMLFSILKNWHDTTAPLGTWGNMTNGDFGIAAVPSPSLFGLDVAGQVPVAILFTAFAVVVALIARTLLESPWGRMMRALRDDELAARGLGKNVRYAKLQAIAIACAIAGFAGAMFASYTAFIDPSLSDLDQSVLLLAMVIVGGVGNSLRGPAAGAALLILIPELLRFVDLPITLAAELRLGIYGLLLILFMHWRPQGIAGNYRME